MKYIQLDGKTVTNIIPEFDPDFPGVPISDRFTAAYIDELIPVQDDKEVTTGLIYEDGEFKEPPEPEPTDEITGEPVPEGEPSLSEDLLTMAVDHEYRLTLLELGLGGEI